VCFFGGVDDCLSRVPRKPLLRVPPGLKVREFQAALALFLVAASFGWMDPVFCKWLCPFKETKGVLDEAAASFPVLRAVQFGVVAVFLAGLPLLTGKRAFCSALCPFGALPPLFRWTSPYRVAVRADRCINCGKCAEACPSFAVDPGPRTPSMNRYCTLCLRCVGACPQGAIRPTLYGKRPTGLIPFVTMLLGGALSMFYAPEGIMALAGLLGFRR
jgi:polyferredoxin